MVVGRQDPILKSMPRLYRGSGESTQKAREICMEKVEYSYEFPHPIKLDMKV